MTSKLWCDTLYAVRLIHDYTVTQSKFDIHKKVQERYMYLYENGEGKKIVSPSKLKLWTFFWGQVECEWPLVLTLVSTTAIQVANNTSFNLHG